MAASVRTRKSAQARAKARRGAEQCASCRPAGYLCLSGVLCRCACHQEVTR